MLIIAIKPSSWFEQHQLECRMWFERLGPYAGLSDREAWNLRRTRGEEIDAQHGFGRGPDGELLPGQRWFNEHQDEGEHWFYRKGPYANLSSAEGWKLLAQRKRDIDRRYGAPWADSMGSLGTG